MFHRDAERKVLHPYLIFGSEAFLCRLPVFIWSLQGLADPCKRYTRRGTLGRAWFSARVAHAAFISITFVVEHGTNSR